MVRKKAKKEINVEPKKALEKLEIIQEDPPEKAQRELSPEKARRGRRLIVITIIVITIFFAYQSLEREVKITIEGSPTFGHALEDGDIRKLRVKPFFYSIIDKSTIHEVTLILEPPSKSLVCRTSATEAVIEIDQNIPLQEILKLAAVGINNIPEFGNQCLTLVAQNQNQQQLIISVKETIVSRTYWRNYRYTMRNYWWIIPLGIVLFLIVFPIYKAVRKRRIGTEKEEKRKQIYISGKDMRKRKRRARLNEQEERQARISQGKLLKENRKRGKLKRS